MTIIPVSALDRRDLHHLGHGTLAEARHDHDEVLRLANRQIQNDSESTPGSSPRKRQASTSVRRNKLQA